VKPYSTLVACLTLCGPLALLTACEQERPAASVSGGASDHGHDHGPDGEHTDAATGHGHHGGTVIELGSATIGAFDVKATRDEGQVVAGKDSPIDVTVTPSAGSTVKAAAVRFWIGTEDAKGSVKAKGDIENPAEPNRWHTHVEIPSPIPAGSKLWVEIETDQGDRFRGRFDLRT
jgi:hypothetical protein